MHILVELLCILVDLFIHSSGPLVDLSLSGRGGVRVLQNKPRETLPPGYSLGLYIIALFSICTYFIELTNTTQGAAEQNIATTSTNTSRSQSQNELSTQAPDIDLTLNCSEEFFYDEDTGLCRPFCGSSRDYFLAEEIIEVTFIALGMAAAIFFFIMVFTACATRLVSFVQSLLFA